MSLYHRTISIGASAPTTWIGQVWIKPIASSTYQTYIYTNSWKPLPSGGTYNASQDSETHSYNVYVQDTTPSTGRPGVIWINSSTWQSFIYLLDEYILLT